jgi:hypothetical protein
MNLALLLITSNRPDLTKRTLESFRQMNGEALPCQLFHADDVSAGDENFELAKAFGCQTILRTTRRHGAHGTRYQALKRIAEIADPTHVFLLENDWRSARPVPWDQVRFFADHTNAYCFRLYGEQKQEDGTRPAGPVHAGRDNADPGWKPLDGVMKGCELGDIHWGAPPHVATMKHLLKLHSRTANDRQVMRESGKINQPVIRVRSNVFWHIGDERTPGFKS